MSKRFMLVVSVLAAVMLEKGTSSAAPSSSERLDVFFTSFTDQWMRSNTDSIASSGYFTGPEFDAATRTLSPRTKQARDVRIRLARQGLAQLREFNRGELTETERISADLMRYQLERRVEAASYDDYSFPFVPASGAPSTLTSVFTVNHRLATPRDAENYVVRLKALAPRMQEAIAEARRIAARKLLPPRFILDAAMREMGGFVSMPPGRSPLVTVFADKMQRIPGLDAARQEQLRAEAARITELEVYPAWRNAIAFVQPLRAQTTDEAGFSRLSGGLGAYAFALRQATTTSLTPEQVHDIGLRVEADVDRDMDRVLRQLGYTEGTVRDRYDAFVNALPRFPDTDQGEADYRADIERTLADAQVRAAGMFDRVPKTNVIAQPYPAYMGSRAASYSTPSADGSRPGTFQFTLQRGGRKYSRSSVYHETVPGHHFQLALELEDTRLPKWRSIRAYGSNSAIVEGWALYAEHLVAEAGWYEGDPAGLLSQLQRKQFRARRLVVDTGLHVKHWTRQQAIDYLGPALETADAASEVDRYVVTPGQACSYMIGALRILELRDKARNALGAKFSLTEFHNVVLGTGSVPLDVLSQQVERWIATNATKP